MKQLIAPVVIVALIIFFVIDDRKDFIRYDDVRTVRSESVLTTGKSTVSVPETKPVADGKTEAAKNGPSAVPVVSPEEAGKLNLKALNFAESYAKRLELLNKGMQLVDEDRINTFWPISIAEEYDDVFQRNNVVKSRVELSTKKIPASWIIDFNSLKGNCDFEIVEDGYRILSPDGAFIIRAPQKKVLNTTTAIQIVLSCNTEETHVALGIEEEGLLKPGKYVYKELSGRQNEKNVCFEISVLDHFDCFRPFLEIEGDVTIHALRIYQKKIEGTTYLEGKIIERSALPDPSKSDYPNCRFTAHFMGNVIKSGTPCPKEMVLIIEGFENYKTINTEKLKSGDKIECAVMSFEDVPAEEQITQQADDLNMYLLDNYYVLSVHKINEYSENEFLPTSGIFFLNDNEEYVSLFERRINHPIPEDVQESQQIAIKHDLEKMNDLLREYDEERINSINLEFNKAWEKEKEKDPPGYNRIKNYVWRNIDNSFWGLPEKYTFLSKPDTLTQQTLDCFSSLKSACEANGVQLIVSLVPDSYVISSRVINSEFKDVPDLQTATYVKQLSEIGIETLYVSDRIIENYNRYPFAFYYPILDSHPFDTTQDCLSDMLAERMTKYGIHPVLDPSLFSERIIPCSRAAGMISVFPSNCDIGQNEEGTILSRKQIYYNDQVLSRDPNGQILVIGNSFSRTPPASGLSSISMFLSAKMLSFVDYYSLGGLGLFSDVMIQLLSRPEFFLKGKRILVLHVGTMHLTEINRKNLMLNLAKADRERQLLNNRTMLASFSLNSDLNGLEPTNSVYWKTIEMNTIFKIEANGEKLFTIPFNTSSNMIADPDKSIVCVIPCVTEENCFCELELNGISHPVFQSRENAKFFNLVFEIPADTKELEVRVAGKPGTFFAIKNIQVWQ